MLLISAMAWGGLASWQWHNDPHWFWIDAAVGVAGMALVSQRRRHPLAVAVVLNGVGAISGAVAGPAILALVSLATRRRWREIIPAAAVTAAAGFTLESINPVSTEPFLIILPAIAAFTAVAVGWGMYIGSRRELLATLEERASAAESNQVERLAHARTAERARIAREMHDVLAHRISMVTMHAGAMTYRDDLDADALRASAAVIQENSHQALVELRQVLGMLRDAPADAQPEPPQPGAADLMALLSESRSAGMRLESDVDIEIDHLPASAARTVYRVVQEALTNVRKHGTHTRATLSLVGSPDAGISLVVDNPLPLGVSNHAPTSGMGLVGLQERVALAGGTVSHEVTPEQHFVLSVWLPWHP